MKILIIGSDSFIAKNFIKQIKDKFVKGISHKEISFPNEVILSDFNQIEQLHFNEIDIVFNFAAIVHRPDIKNEIIYEQINNQLAVLNAKKAKEAGVKLFIQMSTIAVYGNKPAVTIGSEYNPQNPYGLSKLNADLALLEMQDDSFKVAIVRPPMVYGGGKAPGNMMRLIKLVDKGFPLPFKRIDNKRDFINVNHLIQYLAVIAEKKLNGVYLISDHEPVSTEYLLLTIARYLDKRVQLFRVPELGLRTLRKLRPNEYDKLFGTLNITTNFPYENLIQKHSVDEGIKEMVDWYKENKS